MGREDSRVEGDRRGSRHDIGQVDGLPEVEIAGRRAGPSLVVLTTRGLVWKAPMSGMGESSAKPRWSVVMPAIGDVPAPMAGLPGSRAMVCVGPPLYARATEIRIDAHEVAVDTVGEAARGRCVVDEVVAAGDGAPDIAARAAIGHDGVVHGHVVAGDAAGDAMAELPETVQSASVSEVPGWL